MSRAVRTHGMIEGHALALAHHLGERHRLRAVAARRHHHAEHVLVDQRRAGRAEAGREQAVGRRRRAAALQMAEDRHPPLEAGQRLELLRQLERAITELRLDLRHRGLGLGLPGRGPLVLLGLALDLGQDVLGLVQRLGLLPGHGAFGDRDDAEAAAGAAALADRLGHRLAVVGDLGDQDDVGAAGDAGAERQPARVVAHHLDHDDAMVAVGGAVQPVDRVGRDAERGVEAEADVGQRDVVVDRLGQGDDVQALLEQPERVPGGAAAAEADQAVEVVLACRSRR